MWPRGSACLAGSAGTKSPGLPGAASPLACRHERKRQASCHSQAAPTRSSTGGCPGRGLGTCCPGLGQGASPSSHTQGAGSKAICWAGWPAPCPCPAGSPGSSCRMPAVQTLLGRPEEAIYPRPTQASSAGRTTQQGPRQSPAGAGIISQPKATRGATRVQWGVSSQHGALVLHPSSFSTPASGRPQGTSAHGGAFQKHPQWGSVV